MGEKANHEQPEKRYEYLNTPLHVIELAEAVLQQVGNRHKGIREPGDPDRTAEWSSRSNSVRYRLGDYSYGQYDKNYRLEMYLNATGEMFEELVVQMKNYGTPKVYRRDENGAEQLIAEDDKNGAVDQLVEVLTNAKEFASKRAEAKSTDVEFEKLVGRYILSSAAYRPLGNGESAKLTAKNIKQKTDAFNGRTLANEKIALWNMAGKQFVDDAIKAKPNPATDSRFMDIDIRWTTGVTAKELGSKWHNTFDTSKAPEARIDRLVIEPPKELVVQEQAQVSDTPTDDKGIDSDSE